MSTIANASVRAGDLATSTLDGLDPGSVAVVFGTRPEIIKLAGIIELLGPAGAHDFLGSAL